ncbi:GntR family transcriptional regulator [Pelagibius litoralis]|uniref:GntR family transcriptional regulator n=1 Tax=Pelagibius litoralis TaxID=374515 RepID=A0A967KBY6_9PROT|nr:GntR family transcriptional regulator [Pelagibius litoralis]NIA71367.1 GntR family transcriptional regulator [Pelagibius litoralis]
MEHPMPSCHQIVYHTIRQRIRKFQYHPGEVIAIHPTAQGLGISPTPLREVLMRLFAEGLIDHHPNRGFFVNPITIDGILSHYELLNFALRYAVEKITNIDDEERLSAITESFYLKRIDCENKDENTIYSEELEDFYKKILEIINNYQITNVIRVGIDQMHLVRCIDFSIRFDYRDHSIERRLFTDALRAREKDAALAVIDSSFKRRCAAAVDLYKEVIYRINDNNQIFILP